jgi:hypothetical protein
MAGTLGPISDYVQGAPFPAELLLQGRELLIPHFVERLGELTLETVAGMARYDTHSSKFEVDAFQ